MMALRGARILHACLNTVWGIYGGPKCFAKLMGLLGL